MECQAQELDGLHVVIPSTWKRSLAFGTGLPSALAHHHNSWEFWHCVRERSYKSEHEITSLLDGMQSQMFFKTIMLNMYYVGVSRDQEQVLWDGFKSMKVYRRVSIAMC
jgi:hypothetical protein